MLGKFDSGKREQKSHEGKENKPDTTRNSVANKHSKFTVDGIFTSIGHFWPSIGRIMKFFYPSACQLSI